MDSELDAIRAKRLAELSSQQGGGRGGSPSGSLPPGFSAGGGGGQGGQGGEEAQKAQAEEQQRQEIMLRVLSGEARERLSRIALVRPQRARAIEDLLLRMARQGQLRGQVTEAQLLDVLDQVEAAEGGGGGKDDKKAGKIVFSRRKDPLDDDDDW